MEDNNMITCGTVVARTDSSAATVNLGTYTPTERLCIFCAHFSWTAEEMWGVGSEYTGPMFEGGWAECAKKRFKELEAPEDEDDFRRVILQATGCPDYLPPKSEGK